VDFPWCIPRARSKQIDDSRDAKQSIDGEGIAPVIYVLMGIKKTREQRAAFAFMT
jgi:hypothetical protein